MILESPHVAAVPQSESVTWAPLTKQYAERDTLFLLDPDIQQSLDVNGGFVQHTDFDIPSNHYVADPAFNSGSSYVSVVPGRYRNGITSTDLTHGSLQVPMEALPASTFTIEFWMKASAAWSTLGSVRPLQIGTITFGFGGGLFQVTYNYFWTTPTQVAYTLTHSLSSYDVGAGTWGHIALTCDGSKLTLYIDGIQRVQQTGVVPPPAWSTYRGSGLVLLPRPYVSSQQATISDLRISRECRVPGQPVTVNGRPTVTVSSTATGATINKNLLGFVHGLGNAYTQSTMAGKFQIVRTDHFLDTAPIKAGAPDATHPTAGHSGAYSYDWQVADRTLDYIFNTLGAQELYLTIDLTPQILGGTKAPASGTDLTTKRTYQISGSTGAHPSDLTEMAKIVGDLIYHITVEEARTVRYAGVWNEPAGNQLDGADEATKRAYYATTLYPAIANAVKAVDPTIKVGGPEVAGGNDNDLLWVDALISNCQANSVPLDFISWHYYSSDVNEIPLIRDRIDYYRTLYGFSSTLEMIVGEWIVGNGWTFNIDSTGADVEHHDTGAAFYARSLIEMQKANVVRACVYGAEDALDPTFTINGALLTSTHKWATLNVFEQWMSMHSTVVSHALTNSPPFIKAVCSKSGSSYDVFLSCLSWMKTRDWKVDIATPAADGTAVTVYVVDDAHSNYADAGSGHQDLESYSGGTVRNGSVTVTLRPRSSALVRIG